MTQPGTNQNHPQMKFRMHRGTLEDSMEHVVELDSRPELVAYLNRELDSMRGPIADSDVEISYYCFDYRINWRTYLVGVRDWGPVGFADSDFPVTQIAQTK